MKSRAAALVSPLPWAAAWICLIAAVWLYHHRLEDAFARKALLDQSKAVQGLVTLTRAWNAAHGGVYVPLDEKTPANPWLDDPRREITDDKGRVFTKVNPAYMTRQMAEMLDPVNDPIRFHVTSLKPIRPENGPSPWERAALESFEQGATEFSLIDEQGHHFMSPLFVVESCLGCHAKQGYAVGEVRGGLSVSLGPKLVQAAFRSENPMESTGFLSVALLGGAFVYAFAYDRRARRRRKEEEATAQAAFIAAVGHEINTPVNGVVGMIELSLDHETHALSAEHRDNLTHARDAALNLSRLSQRLIEAVDANTAESKPFSPRIAVLEALAAQNGRFGSVEASLELDEDDQDALPLGPAKLFRSFVDSALELARKTDGLDGLVVRLSRTRRRAILLLRPHPRLELAFTLEEWGYKAPELCAASVYSGFNASGGRLNLTGLERAAVRLGGRLTVEVPQTPLVDSTKRSRLLRRLVFTASFPLGDA